MAIYHLSVKTISRSDGRSATAAAAYRAGAKIHCQTHEITHDFRRKNGVISADIILPNDAPKWAADRSKLWNKAEAFETRKNSTLAREFEIALPSELNQEQQRALALEFAREITARHGCAADVAIHAASNDGDQRNAHAHILTTTRRISALGFTEKVRELDSKKSGEIDYWRERFAQLQNEHLAAAGCTARVDHRSHQKRGLSETPGEHLGPTATNIARKAGKSRRGDEIAPAIPTPTDDEITRLEALLAELANERQDEIDRTSFLCGKFAKQQAIASEKMAAEAAKKTAETAAKRDDESRQILEEIKKPKLHIRGGYAAPRSTGPQTSQFKAWRAPDGVTVYLAAQRDAEGRRAAFSDRGDTVNVHMPYNADAVADAVRLAGQKFPDGLTITGSREFRQMAEEEAQKQGLVVRNPLGPAAPPSGAKFRPR